MSEWPKTIPVDPPRFIRRDEKSGEGYYVYDTDVIPADLGQELYEALQEMSELAGVSYNGDPWYWENECSDRDPEAILGRGQEVRARYEREVGS